jgi:O-antigen biosynthesis alpha-1,2-rhamnosyltransferase
MAERRDAAETTGYGAVNGSALRLLVECTYVFTHPNDNSGIQRVVRNIVQQLDSAGLAVQCVPVMVHDKRLWQVNDLLPKPVPRSEAARSQWMARLGGWQDRFWWHFHRTVHRNPFRRSPVALWLFHWVCKIAIAPVFFAHQMLRRTGTESTAQERAEPFEARPSDCLLLLDSSWHSEVFEVVDELKRSGVGVVSVIYDLIPLTHPHFCDPPLVRAFERWFEWVAETAEGYMCISETIRRELEARLTARKPGAAPWTDHFYLGSELDLAQRPGRVNASIAALFEDGVPVYLMVSTIEPRKNHEYLLDAFDRIWAGGANVRLCIIGRVGWKCEGLLRRIRQHHELGKRLFMFNDVDDRSLEFAYARARALVLPSHVEGFGLPLVEAMQRGAPAMASDIPVFREVGGPYLSYFDLGNPDSLAELVVRYEETDRFPAERRLDGCQWLTWRQSCEQRINRVVANHRRQQDRAIAPAGRLDTGSSTNARSV